MFNTENSGASRAFANDRFNPQAKRKHTHAQQNQDQQDPLHRHRPQA